MKAIILAAALALLSIGQALAEEPLVLEAKIPLGDVFGRIDHMAVDVARQRLFVAELGNDSVGIVDLKAGKAIRTLGHLREPQGVGYVAATDTLYVASGLDGSVRLFRGADYAPAASIELGRDADNIRVDAKRGLVFVGYGAGGIAVIDAATRRKRAEIGLSEHPEAFQLAPGGDRIFVNVPDVRQIAVIDRAAAKVVATWPMHDGHANFPMALDDNGARIITVYRRPPLLAAISPKDGSLLAKFDTCGDADDVFADQRRRRLYVSCGEGVVDVLARNGNGYERVARVPTAVGARTSLFVPELDRLFVAVRAVHGPAAPGSKAPPPTVTPASIWVYRPAP